MLVVETGGIGSNPIRESKFLHSDRGELLQYVNWLLIMISVFYVASFILDEWFWGKEESKTIFRNSVRKFL